MTGKDVLDYLSQPRARWVMAGVVAVAALGLGGMILTGGNDGEARAGGGPGLSVAVVAPVEPDVAPGGVMDVGQLTNGFDGKMPEAQTASDATQPPDDYYAEQPAYVEPQVQQMPPPRPGDEVHPYVDRQSPPPPRDGNPRAFGFDQPRPDYAAEREARRAFMEAREAERRARQDRPVAGPDTFY
ncbi:hypothetical protein [Brevundimonas goettingensis]|uniref:Uncharacterized protein n=1 Tax=Brevundimonas goettingensis TaxID=2774190 RepID=A0A975C3C4_9CAUL|nr:hypothetical protein [Brevundimonas goettingensis]QTC91110.1 hypothetical protein IFJ75_18195 [Brevundimonas goettingensis]